jgi:16S rRNA processing protein RimM
MDKDTRVLLGVVGKPSGVRGLVRVRSYTDDPDALADYKPLQDETGAHWRLSWRSEGLAELRGPDGKPVADRTGAEKLVNMKLYVERSQLPPPDDEEFYLTDLMNLQVRDTPDRVVGRVSQIHDYGAGISLEIAKEDGKFALVPFTKACVPQIDIAAGWLLVCWPDAIEVPPDALPEDNAVADITDADMTGDNA